MGIYKPAVSKAGDNMTGALGILATSGVTTHTVTIGSASTGMALYNTSDQTTNYERVRHYWSGNIYNIVTELGGTGAIRNINILANTRGILLNGTASSGGAVQMITGSTSGVGAVGARLTGSYSATSGINIGMEIATIFSGSGTQGFTALKVNPIASTTGNGAQLLIDAAIAGTTKFKVDSAGNITTVGRVVKRTATTTSSATPAINTDTTDIFSITALAVAITSFTTSLTGTPVDGDRLEIRITDNGTARAIAWGTSFQSGGTVALPTSTVISTTLRVLFEWDGSKWTCIAVS